MLKTLIALKGTGRIGKSQTLRHVWELLLPRHEGAPSRHRIIRPVDVRDILTIQGRSVGIESHGDPDEILKEALEVFARQPCEVIICATRTRGQTCDAVNALGGEYQIVWLPKTPVQGSQAADASNAAMARNIVSLTEDALRH